MAEYPPVNHKPLTPQGFFDFVWINWFISLIQTVTTLVVTTLQLQATNSTITSGYTSPEGVIPGETGSLYIYIDGSLVGHIFFKRSSPTTTTGWVEITIP